MTPSRFARVRPVGRTAAVTAACVGLVLTPAAHATATTPQPVTIRATTLFAPPDYQASHLTFDADGALDVSGTWTFPEGKGGAVAVADFTFAPAGGGTFTVRVISRRTADDVDPSTCTGQASEQGRWQIHGGTGVYSSLHGHGDLSGTAVYSGGCAAGTETLTLVLDGVITRE